MVQLESFAVFCSGRSCGNNKGVCVEGVSAVVGSATLTFSVDFAAAREEGFVIIIVIIAAIVVIVGFCS